jgi:hypothetical protein
MNVEPIDLCYKLRQGIQLRLQLPPVVVRPPVAYERLNLRQLHALGLIRDSLPVGSPCRRYASAEVDECRFRHVDVVMLAIVLSECIAALRRNSIQSNACRLMPSSVNWPTSATIPSARLKASPATGSHPCSTGRISSSRAGHRQRCRSNVMYLLKPQ